VNAIIFYLAYPLLFAISKLPFPLFYKLSDLVCFLLYHVVGYRKAVVRSNLKLVFPTYNDEKLAKIERKFYSHLCDLFLEIIKSMSMTKEQMIQRFRVKNIEVLNQFEKENRSIFLMCGHYASWEWMMSLGYHIKHCGYGIYRPISNPYFDSLINRIRSRHNAYMIPQKKASKIIRQKEQEKELGIYGFASDQSPRPTSLTYWRNFLGVNVPVYTGAERLASELNIPVVFSKISRYKRGFYEVEFRVLTSDPKSMKKNTITDIFTEWLESQIKEDPGQYFWTHKRFKYAKKAP
jgi:KDO2-lipid IV(A) lauroyltransferase|tara:strand:- start:4899 stop:5777 length:879 start_codon:yes stop_codon:yes gene_type:complete